MEWKGTCAGIVLFFNIFRLKILHVCKTNKQINTTLRNKAGQHHLGLRRD